MQRLTRNDNFELIAVCVFLSDYFLYSLSLFDPQSNRGSLDEAYSTGVTTTFDLVLCWRRRLTWSVRWC
jgi:hypothetical protein